MDVRSSGRSTANAEQVWATLSDIDAWPDWTPTVTAVSRLRGPDGDATLAGAGIGVGSIFAVTQPRLGRATWVVTTWEPGRSFSWVSRRPGVQTTATHQLRPEETGTAIELGITWVGPGAWLARALFGRMTQRYTDIELTSLVAAVEGGPSA